MTLEDLRRDVLEMFRPPSKESVSEWAERNLIIADKGNPEPGPYRTDRAPYQKEIMDSLTQPGVHDVALMTAAQIGKTLILTAFAGRMIDLDPGPTLLVFPAEDDVDQFAKERLWPTIRQTPEQKGLRRAEERHPVRKLPGGIHQHHRRDEPRGPEIQAGAEPSLRRGGRIPGQRRH